jgi:arginine exporter protein ArgO
VLAEVWLFSLPGRCWRAICQPESRFLHPLAWRVLDGLIALTMLALAAMVWFAGAAVASPA